MLYVYINSSYAQALKVNKDIAENATHFNLFVLVSSLHVVDKATMSKLL